MATLYICRGLPASGKTFWARQFVMDKGFRACRVNRDDLRQMSHNGVFSPEREFFILRAATSMIAQALMHGYDVVSDDTNVQNYICKQLITVAQVCNKNVEWVLFETPLDVCIERDKKRQGSAHVGEAIIRQMLASVEPFTVDMLLYPSTVVTHSGDRKLKEGWTF